MSKYTLTIGEYLQSKAYDAGDLGLSSVELIDKYYEQVFLPDFPFYNDSAEDLTNFKKLFCYTYFMWEIGVETMELFKHRCYSIALLQKPWYVAIWETMQYEFEPLNNYKFTETYQGATHDAGTENTSTSNKGTSEDTKNITSNMEHTGNTVVHADSSDTNTRTDNLTSETTHSTTNQADTQSIHSDTPQVDMTTMDFASSLDRGEATTTDTGTTTTKNTGTTTTEDQGSDDTTTTNNYTLGTTGSETATGTNTMTGTGTKGTTNDGTNNYTRTLEGLQGNASELLEKYRDTIININKLLIKEFEQLFMGVW